MTELPDDDKEERFDMYHFLSRWDVLLAEAAIILLLIWLVRHLFYSNAHV